MASLPLELQKAIRGQEVAITAGDNLIRTEMAVGKERRRRKSTLRVDTMTLNFTVTIPQLHMFESFFKDDLRDGALSFDMIHPVKGGTVTANFDKKGYKFRSIGRAVLLITSTVELRG